MMQRNKISVQSSHSQEMNDITGKSPHWMVSRGSTLLLVVFFLIVGACYFIPYPDTFTTDIHFAYSTAGVSAARFLIPDEKVKDIKPLQKVNIHFLSPSALYPEFTTGKILQISASTEPGFAAASIAFANAFPPERLKVITTKNDSMARAVVTTRSVPLLFVLFQKTSWK